MAVTEFSCWYAKVVEYSSGSINARIRFLWLSVKNSFSGCRASEITRAPPVITTASTPNTSFRLMPPANIITQNSTRITILVERSGCSYTRTHGTRQNTTQEPMMVMVFKFFLCFIINCAKNKINTIFAVSDGWNRSPPISSHL